MASWVCKGFLATMVPAVAGLFLEAGFSLARTGRHTRLLLLVLLLQVLLMVLMLLMVLVLLVLLLYQRMQAQLLQVEASVLLPGPLRLLQLLSCCKAPAQQCPRQQTGRRQLLPVEVPTATENNSGLCGAGIGDETVYYASLLCWAVLVCRSAGVQL